MTSSGTYTFNPSLGDIILYAFGLCGVRPTALTQEHMFSARMAANILQLDWSNEGVNLWEVVLSTPITLVAGTATYNLASNTITMLDAYVTQVASSGNIDRIITPISRTEYASYPNKAQQGTPSVYWCDRLIQPTVTLYQTPDAVTYTRLNYYRVKRIEDAVPASGTTLDVVQRFIPAFIDGLAAQLARTWAPSRVADLTMQAVATLEKAKGQDVERASVYISPQISGYYRN